ncbi:MAG: DegV family protein [Oscillospiraceae bacterium]|jgi:DegV family protein with EDD domain|nr:DegV family protein [Oscillospiraceae bacterium]
MRVAISTDSNSGITQEQAKQMGIAVVPVPFLINGENVLEDISLKQEQFYERLLTGADITTSQSSPADLLDCWDALLEDYDEVVHIPITTGLSNSCETAIMLSQSYDGKVQVADNQRISVTQRQAVLDALKMAQQGFSAAEIRVRLEQMKRMSRIYVIVDTLKYLLKGGRISAASAAMGTILNIKPVLTLVDGKIEPLAKCRGKKAAKQKMLDLMHADFDDAFVEEAAAGKMRIMIAYSANSENLEEAEKWKQEVSQSFPGYEIHMDPLSLSVACHVGPGALALTCSVVI